MAVDISATRKRPDPFDAQSIHREWKASSRLPDRRGVVLLSDAQERIVAAYAALIPKAQRPAFRAAVLARLMPGPAGGAVRAAAMVAALGFVDRATLEAHGLPYLMPKRERDDVRSTSPDRDDEGIE